MVKNVRPVIMKDGYAIPYPLEDCSSSKLKRIEKEDTEIVFELAAIGCSYETIEAVTGLSPTLLSNREDFKEAIRVGREALKKNLLQLQWNSAVKGNVKMQMWLGKQYLGQEDKKQVKVSDEGEGNPWKAIYELVAKEGKERDR